LKVAIIAIEVSKNTYGCILLALGTIVEVLAKPLPEIPS
jgi:hypothetical protein